MGEDGQRFLPTRGDGTLSQHSLEWKVSTDIALGGEQDFSFEVVCKAKFG